MQGKKRFLTALMLALMLLVLPIGQAQASGEFSWNGDLPDGWALFVDGGSVSRFEGSDWAKLSLKKRDMCCWQSRWS